MAVLSFDVEDVRRCLAHALGSKEWSSGYGAKKAPHPQLIFVHDEGLYLMSNGKPRDLDEKHSGPSDKSFVAYAKGYDPTRIDRSLVWDRARAAVGGDDFAEYLTLSRDMAFALMERTCDKFALKVTATRIEIVVTHKKAPASKVAA